MNLNESIANFLSGDLKAFEILYKKHYSSLFHWAKSITGNSSLAEDLTQDAFLKLWESHKNFKLPFDFKAYLFKTLYNIWLNHLKHQKIVKDYENTTISQPEKWYPSNDYSQTTISNYQLQKYINQLPERCRLIFLLSTLKNLKHKEIAEQLKISPKTVEVQMRKARIFLKEELTK